MGGLLIREFNQSTMQRSCVLSLLFTISFIYFIGDLKEDQIPGKGAVAFWLVSDGVKITQPIEFFSASHPPRATILSS